MNFSNCDPFETIKNSIGLLESCTILDTHQWYLETKLLRSHFRDLKKGQFFSIYY